NSPINSLYRRRSRNNASTHFNHCTNCCGARSNGYCASPTATLEPTVTTHLTALCSEPAS
ncbi:MAG: hypothetical protein QF579_05610, partial [Dehalococcoidia bacterium]|nr:hypothetical protein [Dehalococcoidia bacterium]